MAPVNKLVTPTQSLKIVRKAQEDSQKHKSAMKLTKPMVNSTTDYANNDIRSIYKQATIERTSQYELLLKDGYIDDMNSWQEVP
ncbi:hypothetical protein D3C72_1921800 [compost metagenome]